MEYANMIPNDLTPCELAQKMEARWELLEIILERIFHAIEDVKVINSFYSQQGMTAFCRHVQKKVLRLRSLIVMVLCNTC
jgi:hypothetical protein